MHDAYVCLDVRGVVEPPTWRARSSDGSAFDEQDGVLEAPTRIASMAHDVDEVWGSAVGST